MIWRLNGCIHYLNKSRFHEFAPSVYLLRSLKTACLTRRNSTTDHIFFGHSLPQPLGKCRVMAEGWFLILGLVWNCSINKWNTEMYSYLNAEWKCFIYRYSCQVSRVFVNDLETGVQSLIESYQRLKKWYVMLVKHSTLQGTDQG